MRRLDGRGEVRCDFSDWASGATVEYDRKLVESLPWRGIASVLESVEAETAMRPLAQKTLVAMESLIPYDHAGFLVANAHDITHAELLVHRRADESLLREYIAHYIHLDPTLPFVRTTERFENSWRRHPETEFTRDFIARIGTPDVIGISDLCLTGSLGFVVVLHRRGSHGFSEREKLTLSALWPHMHHLSSALISPVRARMAMAADILSAAGLSPREKEVAMLLRQCPTVAEIAEQLRISRKTAATHLGRIYMKLDARGKRDVMTRLFQENTYF